MREILVKKSYSALVSLPNQAKSSFPGKKLTEIVNGKRSGFISLEVCPNRGFNTELLSDVSPRFCSVTWLGQYTDLEEIPPLTLASQLQGQGYDVLLHLAGKDLNKTTALYILNKAKNMGVRNILALQGDRASTKNGDKCDFPYATDLIRFIKENFGSYFCIAVAGYPEKHPRSKNVDEDLTYLRAKVSCGADFIITQASFKYEAFESFCRNCRKFSINVPVVCGMYIISSYTSLVGMSKFFSVPDDVMKFAYDNRNNPEVLKEYGVNLATEWIRNILSSDNNLLSGAHIFTLNNLEVVSEVLKRLGIGSGTEKSPKN